MNTRANMPYAGLTIQLNRHFSPFTRQLALINYPNLLLIYYSTKANDVGICSFFPPKEIPDLLTRQSIACRLEVVMALDN